MDEADTLADDLDRLHEHLRATEGRPLDPTTNRWLGEAQAIAADLATSEVDPETARSRVETVLDLLSEIEDADDPAAAEEISAARTLCAEILE